MSERSGILFDSARVEEAANQYKVCIEDQRAAVKSMQNAIQNLESQYSGKAAEKAKEHFSGILSQVKTMESEIESLIQGIQAASKGQSEAEVRAVNEFKPNPFQVNL